MGDDAQSVVDARPRGNARCAVCTSPMRPSCRRIVSGSTNAPTIMIAERAAGWLLD
jgi:hypothetical protein